MHVVHCVRLCGKASAFCIELFSCSAGIPSNDCLAVQPLPDVIRLSSKAMLGRCMDSVDVDNGWLQGLDVCCT